MPPSALSATAYKPHKFTIPKMGSYTPKTPSPKTASFPTLASPSSSSTLQSNTMGWHLLPRHQSRRHAHGVAVSAHMATPPAHHLETAHSISLRKFLGTHGLLPPRPDSYDVQEKRCLAQLALKPNNIEKYLYLATLRKNNVHLFYRLLVDHFTELTPLVYTPTVGEACQRWSEIYQGPEGMYLSFEDRGHIASVIQNWPEPHVEITVITDGSRILGLGDLGINGMGIPIGKLALYTGCAGIRPEGTLPLTIDLGTSTKSIREDPLYLGSRRDKVTAQEEQEFLDELMVALKARWPDIVIQFEDWKNPFPSLERYRNKYACFNDDIQGTGAVIMGGVINAIHRTGISPRDHRAVFFGAGSAGVGVARQIVDYFIHEGLSEEEARSCFWLVDTKGLVTSDRGDTLADHKVYFSRHDNQGNQYRTLQEVVDFVKPTILMGLSTQGGVFTPDILRKMAGWNRDPIIFPLSNPSSKSECTFEDAIRYTDGRAIFASGSPFPPYTYKNSSGQTKTYYAGQGNNVFVFPGIGLGAILCKAVKVTDSMIYASGDALSTALTTEEVDRGLIYPDINRIRSVSVVVTRQVIRAAQEDNVDRLFELRDLSDSDLDRWIRTKMYDPHAEIGHLETEVADLATQMRETNLKKSRIEVVEKEVKL